MRSAEISIAIVDDETIHDLNRRYLKHDYATDVLSFVLDRDEGHLDGEVIASAETASRVGRQFSAPADDELLLYVVHGMLHLVGFDDQTPAAAKRMRKEEQKILDQLAPSVAAAANRREPRRAAKTRTGRNRE